MKGMYERLEKEPRNIKVTKGEGERVAFLNDQGVRPRASSMKLSICPHLLLFGFLIGSLCVQAYGLPLG